MENFDLKNDVAYFVSKKFQVDYIEHINMFVPDILITDNIENCTCILYRNNTTLLYVPDKVKTKKIICAAEIILKHSVKCSMSESEVDNIGKMLSSSDSDSVNLAINLFYKIPYNLYPRLLSSKIDYNSNSSNKLSFIAEELLYVQNLLEC